MSRPIDHSYNPGVAERFEHPYDPYEGAYTLTHPRSVASHSHFDGVGFWYRPNQTETILDRNSAVFHHNSSTSVATGEPTISVKHRRTRSGCFTCRQRRVKCDERRPICERCRKGNRHCDFPETSSSTKRTARDGLARARSQSESREPKSTASPALDTIEDESSAEDEGQEQSESPEPAPPRSKKSRIRMKSLIKASQQDKLRQRSDTEETNHEHPTSKEESSDNLLAKHPSISGTSTPVSTFSPKWKHLSPQIQDCLQFQRDFMTHHHYFFLMDPTDFIHTKFIDVALSFPPLLNAVVAFASYHQTIRQSTHGLFNDFWKFYCQSIIQLRKWLEKHKERNEAVLLTILQLATFEEYLGDWANLASHHRAAHSIMSLLYSLDDFLSTETSRHIFDWFGRVDIIASLMAGSETVLDRDWFAESRNWHLSRFQNDRSDVNHAVSYLHTAIRLTGFDMARSFAHATSSAHFTEEAAKISARLDKIRHEILVLHRTAYSITGSEPSSGEEDHSSPVSFDTRVPLFRDDLSPLNYIWMAWYSSYQMYLFQTTSLSRAFNQQADQELGNSAGIQVSADQLPPELEKLSLAQYQIYEGIERWPSAPTGAVLSCHAALGLATIFLRQESRFTMRARRKLANVERMGYIWPPVLRKRMAQLWGDDEILDWWLPQGEGKPALLEEIRGVVEERNRENVKRGVDDGRTDLREIKAIFNKLDVVKSGRRATTLSDAGSGSGFGTPSDGGSSEGPAGFSPPVMRLGTDTGRPGRPKARGRYVVGKR